MNFIKTYWMWILLPIVLVMFGLLALYFIGRGSDGPSNIPYELI